MSSIIDIPAIVATALSSTPIPFLRPAFDCFRLIWNSIQKTRINRAQLSQLAICIAELLAVLQRQYLPTLTAEQSTSLDRFERLLEEISSLTSDLQTRHFLKCLFQKDEIAASIEDYHRRLFHACDAFNISTLIDLNGWLHESEISRRRDHAALEALLSQLSQDQGELIKILQLSDAKQDVMVSMMIALQQSLSNIANANEKIFMRYAIRVLQRQTGQDLHDLPWWTVTSWEVDVDTPRKAIGTGGFGQVFPATWHGTRVAVKQFDSRTSIELLKKEIDIWSKLHHPHVVHFLGAAIHESPPFLLMPLLANGNALQYIERNPAADRGLLVHQVALGLAYLHSRQQPVLHGDLKAVNVLIDKNGDALLADFGSSKLKQDFSRTTNISLPGSARWMAPERLREGKLNMAVDVYAWAMTTFEVYTLCVPFGHTPDSMLFTLVVEKSRRPSQHAISGDADHAYSLEPRIWAILTAAWHADPQQRPSAQDLVSMTNGLAAYISSPPSPPPPPPPPPPLPPPAVPVAAATVPSIPHVVKPNLSLSAPPASSPATPSTITHNKRPSRFSAIQYLQTSLNQWQDKRSERSAQKQEKLREKKEREERAKIEREERKRQEQKRLEQERAWREAERLEMERVAREQVQREQAEREVRERAQRQREAKETERLRKEREREQREQEKLEAAQARRRKLQQESNELWDKFSNAKSSEREEAYDRLINFRRRWAQEEAVAIRRRRQALVSEFKASSWDADLAKALAILQENAERVKGFDPDTARQDAIKQLTISSPSGITLFGEGRLDQIRI